MINKEREKIVELISLNEESGNINEKGVEDMPKKKVTRRKKVTFWATVKKPKRVKVEFYAKRKTPKQAKTKKG